VLQRLLEPKEYTGDLFATACRRAGVTQSMGRTGSALDNAVAESFNSTLEFELLRGRRFATREQARRAVSGWIDEYNTVRRHSTDQMLAPVDYERIQARRTRGAAA
jgi:transposase InsO family protein